MEPIDNSELKLKYDIQEDGLVEDEDYVKFKYNLDQCKYDHMDTIHKVVHRGSHDPDRTLPKFE